MIQIASTITQTSDPAASTVIQASGPAAVKAFLEDLVPDPLTDLVPSQQHTTGAFEDLDPQTLIAMVALRTTSYRRQQDIAGKEIFSRHSHLNTADQAERSYGLLAQNFSTLPPRDKLSFVSKEFNEATIRQPMDAFNNFLVDVSRYKTDTYL